MGAKTIRAVFLLGAVSFLAFLVACSRGKSADTAQQKPAPTSAAAIASPAATPAPTPQEPNAKTCFQGPQALKFADDDAQISKEDLKQQYKWNGQLVLWRLDNTFDGIETPNGSMYVLGKDVRSPNSGIPVGWGSGGKTFGRLCFGNLELVGEVRFLKGGLLLTKGSHLIYPK